MLVDGHREGRAAVAEALADDLHRDAGLQQDRGVGVTQVVKADPREGRLGEVAVEGLAEEVGMGRTAVERSEDDAGVIGSVAESEPLLELCLPPGPHHGDGSGIEVDGAPDQGPGKWSTCCGSPKPSMMGRRTDHREETPTHPRADRAEAP